MNKVGIERERERERGATPRVSHCTPRGNWVLGWSDSDRLLTV